MLPVSFSATVPLMSFVDILTRVPQRSIAMLEGGGRLCGCLHAQVFRVCLLLSQVNVPINRLVWVTLCKESIQTP